MISYDGRRFRSVSNSAGGDVGRDTVFCYRQRGDVVWATYEGGAVKFGILVAKADALGNLDMRYQHVSGDGSFRSGRCLSSPEKLRDGRLRLREQWEWTAGEEGEGVSILEELPEVAAPMARPSNAVWAQCLATIEPILASLGFSLFEETIHRGAFGSCITLYERSDMAVRLVWDGKENWIDASYATRDRNNRHIWNELQALNVAPPSSNVHAHVLRPGRVADEYIHNLGAAIRSVAAH
jgi:hypothetical protein